MFNSQAVAASSAGEVTLADGKRLKADLVIGADGVNSKVRDSLGLVDVESRWSTVARGC